MAASPTTVKVNLDWIEAEIFERRGRVIAYLEDVHGILVPGGFGERGAEGKIAAARFARERDVPYFGICFGMQMAVIEAARNLAGIEGAELDRIRPAHGAGGRPDDRMDARATSWRAAPADGDLGGTMRLGAYDCDLAKPGSKVAEIYGATEISERHRHRYEVNIALPREAGSGGLAFSGLSPDGAAAGDRRDARTIPGSSACSSTPN